MRYAWSFVAAASLLTGCNYNKQTNSETGTADTSGKDRSTKELAAPAGEDRPATGKPLPASDRDTIAP